MSLENIAKKALTTILASSLFLNVFSQDGPWPGLDLDTLAHPSTNYEIGNTSGDNDNCSWRTGRDNIYQFTTTQTADISIDLCDSNFNTWLYVYSISAGNCSGGDFIAKNDDSCGLQSQIILTEQAPGTYVVVIEPAFSDLKGKYKLNIDVSDPAPLPIELISFKAKCEEKGINLTWATASEFNNDYFTLEKSKEGKSFYSFKIIPGAGNTHQKLEYSVLDNNPYDGINYYRLKQTDYNGKSEYLGVEACNCSKPQRETLEVYDLLGKRIKNPSKPGMYILKEKKGDEIVYRKSYMIIP